MKQRQWTSDELKDLKRLYPTTGTRRLSEILSRSHYSIYMKAFNLGLKKCPSYLADPDHSGRFTRENRPTPRNSKAMPIGTIRLNSDGVYVVKFTDEHRGNKNWKSLLRHIWEQAGHTVPANHFIAFKDGRKTTAPHNISIDMLECVTMSQFASRNRAIPKEIQLLQRNMREILMEVQKSSPVRSGVTK